MIRTMQEELQTTAARAIDPRVDIGHVHLKVSDIDRALSFYCGILGFELMTRMGDDAAFISAGGYHHHIGLNTWESRGGSPPDALRRLLAAGVSIDGASDHGVSEAIYLRDPDQIGIELYRDRPQEEWPRTPDGEFTMTRAPLDLQALLDENPDA
jgi:catechol 2,3-dioxygenase